MSELLAAFLKRRCHREALSSKLGDGVTSTRGKDTTNPLSEWEEFGYAWRLSVSCLVAGSAGTGSTKIPPSPAHVHMLPPPSPPRVAPLAPPLMSPLVSPCLGVVGG